MSLPKIATREEWLAARKDLLAKEKELTRQRDALNTERRNLPMVEIDKDYVFDGPDGHGAPHRPVRRPPAADHLPLHVRPGVGGRLPELHRRHRRAVATASSTTCTPATRATPWCRGRRWRSSSGGRPSRAGTSPGTRRSAPTSTTTSASRSTSRSTPTSTTSAPRPSSRPWARTSSSAEQPFEMPGRSCFLQVDGRVFHTYSQYARGLESHRRLVLLPRPHRARPPGGVGGAEGPQRLGAQGPRPTSQLDRCGQAAGDTPQSCASSNCSTSVSCTRPDPSRRIRERWNST